MFSWLRKLGSTSKRNPNKILTVVTHIEPFVSLNPFKLELHLCADYYTSEWTPEDGAMFGKEYPGIALGWGFQNLDDAARYAKKEGYGILIIERLLSLGVTEPIYSLAG